MRGASIQPGEVLGGRYRVERVLGRGNMGVVVAASHVDLAQRVAVKCMHPFMAAKPNQRERFLREARATVRLKSQHVARMLDVGTLENGSPFIVMEFLEGRDLAALLKAKGPLSVRDAVELMLQSCEAVGEAHAAGIVHRDLKPANLFVTKDVSGSPCVKVLDFGISKVAGEGLALTSDEEALGTPLYMSPEQMNSAKDVDGRSDIWALGVVLYELLAGRTPFHAETAQELWARVLTARSTPLRDHRSKVPQGLEAAILRCIQRDREQRWQNVAELAGALAPYAPARASAYPERVANVLGFRSFQPASTPAPASSGPPSAVGETSLTLMSSQNSSAQPFGTPPARPRRRASFLIAGAIVAVAASTAIFVAVHAWGPPAVPTSTLADLPPATPSMTPPTMPPTMTASPAAIQSHRKSPVLSPPSASASSPAASTPPGAKPPLPSKPSAKSTRQAKPRPTVSFDR